MDFKAKYNRDVYLNFFQHQLLPDDFEVVDEKLSDFKPDRIRSAIKIGEVPSLELIVLEVRHESENDPRISLSRETFRLLANYGKQRALVIFTSKNSDNFRLSLVTIDLKWEQGDKPTKEYSNPKRFSFFLGPDAKVHTPQQYLEKRVKDFEDLKQRFSIEVVNKEFYDLIATLFTQLTGGKRGTGKKTIDMGKGLLILPQTADDTIKKNFAVRLIGRLIFCWFLKKKHSKNNLPLLPEELLSVDSVTKKCVGGFYHSILEPLFFEVLNTPQDSRKNKFKKDLWVNIPFLNGGLFTPHEDDYYELADIYISKHINTLIIPDNWLKGLFDVFETYNFTIDENTSVDVELSIEPEMLGRIFENLLAEINPETGETARKSTGSYYTPRSIVEYMVDESLRQYLLTKTGLPEEKISQLLSYSDEDAKLTETQKDSVLDALDAIKIIDPACGSGAFPMGILQKALLVLHKIDPQSKKWLQKILARIENTTARKEIEKKLKEEDWNYVHKLGIIQNSIYGVDIQPIAIEISKLRCFLSLIVNQNIDDAQPNRGVEPLPNLDFRFVCGNSLIDTIFGLPVQLGTLAHRPEVKRLIDNIEQNKSMYFSLSTEKDKVQMQLELLRQKLELAEYFIHDKVDELAHTKTYTKSFIDDTLSKKDAKAKATNEAIKKDLELLRKQVNGVHSTLQIKKIRTYQDIDKIRDDYFSKFFAWRIDFAEVFANRNGFDIAIGNPPYVDSEHMTKSSPEDRELISKLYTSAQGNWDLYIPFWELGFNLLTANGTATFITPSKWLSIKYGETLRCLLVKDICRIGNCDKVKVFDAGNSPVILFANKTRNSKIAIDNFAANFQISRGAAVAQSILLTQDWGLLLSEHIKLLLKIGNTGKTVGNDFYAENPFTVSEAYEFKLLIQDLNKISSYDEKEHFKFVNTGTIDRYRYLWGHKPTTYIKDKYTYPIVKRTTFRKDFPKRFEQMNSKKIVISGMRHFECVLDSEGTIIAGKSTVILKGKKTSDYEDILGILNSKLITFYIREAYNNLGIDGGINFTADLVESLPLPTISSKRIKDVVAKILSFISNEDYDKNASQQAKIVEYIREIDEMVYKLYDLTPEEIAIIEGSNTK